MQGLFINSRRPKSKKEIKDAVKDGRADEISAEATSMFPGEYQGPITEMPSGSAINFVGPDPYERRNFYGTITRNGDRITVK